MENNNKVPTLEDLIKNTENFNKKYPDYDYKSNINLLQEIINLISNFKNFHKFLEDKCFDDYELPYIVFWELLLYLEKCFFDNNQTEVINIFLYLSDIYKNWDIKVKDLILVWLFENLDHFTWDLWDLLKKMPIDLKKVFLKYYSHYLK